MHRLGSAELSVGRPEILQQDAPGDAIDDQVVHDDEQAARLLWAEVKEGDPQQGPFRQVQARLQCGRCRRHSLFACSASDSADKSTRENGIAPSGPALICCQPEAACSKPQAERIVVPEQVLHHLL